jgi:hypothetical protein
VVHAADRNTQAPAAFTGVRLCVTGH